MKQLYNHLEQITENVIIVGLFPHNNDFDIELDLMELRGLVKAAGGSVRGELVQIRDKPDPNSFLGKGKIEELLKICQDTDSDTIVFDNDLKPNQSKNISNILEGRKVIDRSGIILDIFATRARTMEAKLQVEIAQLRYILPRLSGMWAHLERQQGGIGTRGPGETQLEKDRRVIQKRISSLRKKLEKVEAQRTLRRSGRNNHKRVALVGYTNAGKSTLLNALTGADAKVMDMLFATLDPTTRRLVKPPYEHEQSTILLTDTVGFIRKLPHSLIESFKSTLGEARESDLLILVADMTHSAVLEHIETVRDVLKELNIEDKDSILVLNKMDQADEQTIITMTHRFTEAVLISAKSQIGLDHLKERIYQNLFG